MAANWSRRRDTKLLLLLKTLALAHCVKQQQSMAADERQQRKHTPFPLTLKFCPTSVENYLKHSKNLSFVVHRCTGVVSRQIRPHQ